MELGAVRSLYSRRPSAEALTWLVTATMLAAGSLLPEPNAGMSIAVAHGLLVLLPVVAVAALLAGALTLDNWSEALVRHRGGAAEDRAPGRIATRRARPRGYARYEPRDRLTPP